MIFGFVFVCFLLDMYFAYFMKVLLGGVVLFCRFKKFFLRYIFSSNAFFFLLHFFFLFNKLSSLYHNAYAHIYFGDKRGHITLDKATINLGWKTHYSCDDLRDVSLLSHSGFELIRRYKIRWEQCKWEIVEQLWMPSFEN